MYSLTICFGPAGTTWVFLFKDRTAATSATIPVVNDALFVKDDFGQEAKFEESDVHGWVIEDLDQTESARIQRSLAEERIKVKLMDAAKSDPVIGAALRRQQGAPVLTPMGGGFR